MKIRPILWFKDDTVEFFQIYHQSSTSYLDLKKVKFSLFLTFLAKKNL